MAEATAGSQILFRQCLSLCVICLLLSDLFYSSDLSQRPDFEYKLSYDLIPVDTAYH